MISHVNWPCQYDPKTSANYALNDIDVNAPPEVVWKLLVDAENWSSYFPADGATYGVDRSTTANSQALTWATVVPPSGGQLQNPAYALTGPIKNTIFWIVRCGPS